MDYSGQRQTFQDIRTPPPCFLRRGYDLDTQLCLFVAALLFRLSGYL